MDLLVQVATAHKINPSGHLIQAPGERGDLFTCKPNTAIGSLDVNRVLVVPKSLGAAAGHSADLPFRHAASRPGGRTSKQQPFEVRQMQDLGTTVRTRAPTAGISLTFQGKIWLYS